MCLPSARCSVLLVEDNATDALLLEEALAELEFAGQLTVVIDGEEALAHLRTRPLPDILLMDMHMPRMTGVEVVQALNEPLVSVKVVLWSAAFSPREALEVKASDVDLYLEKPSTYADLLDVLRQILTL